MAASINLLCLNKQIADGVESFKSRIFSPVTPERELMYNKEKLQASPYLCRNSLYPPLRFSPASFFLSLP